MELLKKKFNEIGMQASGFYQSSFCVICNGKYHLFNDSDEGKEPKPRTHITNKIPEPEVFELSKNIL